VVVGEPVEFMMAFVDTRWMNTDRLVVGYISPAFTIAREQLWIEAPCYDRACDEVVVAVYIGSLWKVKKKATPGGEPYSIKILSFNFSEGEETRVNERNN
jgi:hypothetical protein